MCRTGQGEFSVKRLVIAGGLLGGLGLILACSEEPQQQTPTPPAHGGSTAAAGTGGSTAGSTTGGMGGGGGSDTGGTAGSGGTGGSLCATDCKALGQICDMASASCMCPGYNPDHCPAANLCTDFIDDTEHCGNCDTACTAVQACSAGACTADPVEVYTTAAGCGSLKLLIVGTTIYIMNVGAGTISSVPAAGGAATADIVTGLTAPVAFAVDANNFYVASGMTIDRFPLAGGAAEPVVTEATEIWDVTVDTGGMLYYPVGTDIKSIDATEDAGTGTVVATAVDAGTPQSVAVDGDLVFWGASTAFNVEVDSITTDAPVKLGASQGSLIFGHQSLQTDGTNVYWANGGQMARRAYDGVTGQETVGGTRENGSITAFAVTAMDGYWAADGNIEKGQVGGDAVWLARGQGVVGGMVVDASSVFWSTDACKIFKTGL